MKKKWFQCLGILSATLLVFTCVLTTVIIQASASSGLVANFEGADAETDAVEAGKLAYADSTLQAVIDDEAYGDGERSLRITGLKGGGEFGLNIPETVDLTAFTRINFYLKLSGVSKLHFTFSVGNDEVTYTYDSNQNIQIKTAGSGDWEDKPYWGGYGAEWTANWEGNVSIPLEAFSRTWQASGKNYPVDWAAPANAKIKIWIKDDVASDESGKVYFDAMNAIDEASPSAPLTTAGLIDFSGSEGETIDPTVMTYADNSLSIKAATLDGLTRAKVMQYKNGGQFNLSLPEAAYETFGEIRFSLEIKSPTKFHFIFNIGTSGRESNALYAITQSTKILVRAEGEEEWVEMDYWGNWGPEFTTDFKGDVRIPLDAYSRKDGTDLFPEKLTDPSLLEELIIWAKDEDGTDACEVYWGDIRGVKGKFPVAVTPTPPTEEYPTQPPVERPDALTLPGGVKGVPYQNYEALALGDSASSHEFGAASIMFPSLDSDVSATVVPSPVGGKAVKFSHAAWQEWVQTFFFPQSEVSLEGTTGLMFYVKRENVSKADSQQNFTVALQSVDEEGEYLGGYLYEGSTMLYLPKGETKWVSVDHYSGWGANFNKDVDGYFLYPFSGFKKQEGDVPGRLDPAVINRMQLWINNFGGVHGDLLMDDINFVTDMSQIKMAGDPDDTNPSGGWIDTATTAGTKEPEKKSVAFTGILLGADGKPVNGGTVLIENLSASAKINVKGEFSFSNVPMGLHTLSVKDADGNVVASQHFVLSAETSTELIGTRINVGDSADGIYLTVQIENDGLSFLKVEALKSNGGSLSPSTGSPLAAGSFAALFVAAAALAFLSVLKRKAEVYES